MRDLRRVAAALAIVLSLRAAASAQPVPARVIVATPSGNAVVGGITVQGRGTVRRPADSARFTIMVGNRAQPDTALNGADALVAALRKAGIADAALTNPTSALVSANQFAVVGGTLRKPTLDAVHALIATVAANVPSALNVQNVNVTLLLDDCSAAENAAIAGATADARARAERIAAAAHVTLGGVIAVSAQSPTTPPCPTKPDAVIAQFGGGPGELSQVTGTFDVAVSVFETVTFAIR